MEQQPNIQNSFETLGLPTGLFKGKAFGLLTLPGMALLLPGIFVTYLAYSASGTNQIIYAFLALPLLVLGVILILMGVRRANGLFLKIYAQGFEYIDGKQNTFYRWDDIAVVWQNISRFSFYGVVPLFTSHIYTLRLANGTELKISDEFDKITELGSTIQAEVTKRLLPQYIAAYERGEDIRAVPLTINQKGITYVNRTATWAQFAGAQLQQGFLSLRVKGKHSFWVNLLVGDVPNLYVLLALIDHIMATQQQIVSK